MTMTATTVSNMRLFNQHIDGDRARTVHEVVRWMGAIQAQDYKMAKYAIAVRLKKADDRSIEEAINSGQIIRTHVLRPTWHFVAADDVRWMMYLTADNLKRALSSNNKRLDLDEKTFRKSNTIIEKILRDGRHLTRKEIMTALAEKGIRTDELRSLHIMFRAETDLLVCNGIKRDKQMTYALFDERVPTSTKPSKEEALARLAERYFLSHGPATIDDFTWWSGLSMTEAKTALELVKQQLESERLNGTVFWFYDKPANSKNRRNKLFLLPSFDEFLISYKSREISLDEKNAAEAFTSNGIFRPIIVHNSRVIGTWKPQFKKEITINSQFFKNPTDEQKRLFANAAKKFVRHVEGQV